MLELLIVEDDQMMRESLAMLLGREGFAVSTADSGETALQVTASQTFDVVICDIRMPGVDGIETVRRIRQAQPEVHLILITGYASEDAPIQALRLQVDDYFRKPFDMPSFVERIRAIGRGRLRSGKDVTWGLRRFAELLRTRNPQWGEHAQLTDELCKAVADRVGLGGEDLAALRLAALYHDLLNLETPLPPMDTAVEDGESVGTLERAAALLGTPRPCGLASSILDAVVGHLGNQPIDGDVAVKQALLEALQQQPTLQPAPPSQPTVEAAPRLHIVTLGALRVEVDGRVLARADWESASARSLFLFLLCQRGRRVAEDTIADTFWPAADMDKARGAIKTAVYRIRKALGMADAVLTGERYYQFNAGLSYRWDLDVLEQSSERGRALQTSGELRAALKSWSQGEACWRGPFLEGMEDEWIQPLRERALGLAVECRGRQASLLLTLGDAAAAVEKARAALQLEPTSEEAQVVLVRALGESGRRDEAIRAYHAAADTLKRELGLQVGPELARAYLEITS